MLQPNKNFIFSCSHCSCTTFILTSYSLYTQVMLILILNNVQYLHNVISSFEKGSNGQNHSSSDSQHPLKQSIRAKFPIIILAARIPSHHLRLFAETCRNIRLAHELPTIKVFNFCAFLLFC